MKILDLFCGVGGASMGYHLAGATQIVGVDREEQPNYPFSFVKMCVIDFLKTQNLSSFDFIHASPPCLTHTLANVNAKAKGREYEDFLEETRHLLIHSGKPYCIENVMGAKLKKWQAITEKYKEKLFKSSVFSIEHESGREIIYFFQYAL